MPHHRHDACFKCCNVGCAYVDEPFTLEDGELIGNIWEKESGDWEISGGKLITSSPEASVLCKVENSRSDSRYGIACLVRSETATAGDVARIIIDDGAAFVEVEFHACQRFVVRIYVDDVLMTSGDYYQGSAGQWVLELLICVGDGVLTASGAGSVDYAATSSKVRLGTGPDLYGTISFDNFRLLYTHEDQDNCQECQESCLVLRSQFFSKRWGVDWENASGPWTFSEGCGGYVTGEAGAVATLVVPPPDDAEGFTIRLQQDWSVWSNRSFKVTIGDVSIFHDGHDPAPGRIYVQGGGASNVQTWCVIGDTELIVVHSDRVEICGCLTARVVPASREITIEVLEGPIIFYMIEVKQHRDAMGSCEGCDYSLACGGAVLDGRSPRRLQFELNGHVNGNCLYCAEKNGTKILEWNGCCNWMLTVLGLNECGSCPEPIHHEGWRAVVFKRESDGKYVLRFNILTAVNRPECPTDGTGFGWWELVSDDPIDFANLDGASLTYIPWDTAGHCTGTPTCTVTALWD